MTFVKSYAISLEDYFILREAKDEVMEYIDGIVYISPSPSEEHEKVSNILEMKFRTFLEGKDCEVLHTSYDIELKNHRVKGSKIIIPDISIICDKEGLINNRYIGVPSLIVEILSPLNQSHDFNTKLNIYMKYGVKEYWIVNPMFEAITVYSLNSEELYEQYDMKIEKGELKSKLLDGFIIDLEGIFK